MFHNFAEIQTAQLNGLGMNNVSRSIFPQFKSLNNLSQDTSRGSNIIQAVEFGNKVYGFSVINNLSDIKTISIRQNYKYDGMFIAELKTGNVYSVTNNNFIMGSITRKTAKSGVNALNTIINTDSLLKVNLNLYPAVSDKLLEEI
ncbi:hypothetical protein [Yersinia phage fHe-Yen9-04]|uniref:Uncharacterized protein n=1 Tax=Yersinia phage fHe-Yen9-04 TaxID=2052742 RepID=A0A2C9CYE8_9CAUD|nr:hypothetical protein FDJ41_gp081 [Yersinia phage fHe-Yen9-04]SOK58358.1 hypothetical protein [Yersinia phage fHe-Yen9-04]VUE36127.1 hypothetical protein [Yersinia phage fHe-Yen9-04]